jgi:hypothetical protein
VDNVATVDNVQEARPQEYESPQIGPGYMTDGTASGDICRRAECREAQAAESLAVDLLALVLLELEVDSFDEPDLLSDEFEDAEDADEDSALAGSLEDEEPARLSVR